MQTSEFDVRKMSRRGRRPDGRPYKVGGKISFATRHYCRLDAQDVLREVPEVAPFAPFNKRFLNGLKTWTVASKHNPRGNEFFKSNSELYEEKRRQLRSESYRKIIHPLSRIAMIRNFVICKLWIMAFFLDPLFASFFNSYIEKNEYEHSKGVIEITLNTLFLVDIVYQFFSGYIIHRTKDIVLDRHLIVSHYLHTYFAYDVIPVVYSLFYHITNTDVVQGVLPLPKLFHVWLSLPQVYCIRFVRIGTMTQYFGHIFRYFKLRDSIVKVITITLCLFLICHWVTCALCLLPVIGYYLGNPLDDSIVLRSFLGRKRRADILYFDSFLTASCHFLGAGKGNMLTTNPLEQLVLALIIICGATVHIGVIASILQLFGTINVSETKYEELIYQLNEYMITKKLPQPLRKRLLMYYEYRFQKHFFTEEKILDSLSEHLRCEVRLYSCKNLIHKVKMFQGAPKEVIGALVALLKHEIFLPNDHIIKPDALSENVYFISFGTVAIYLSNGREAVHLEDGHNFGEMQAVLESKSGGWDYHLTVVAIETTEVFYLDRKDFWFVVATYPEIADSIEKSALAKWNYCKSILSEPVETVVDTSDILMELRRGSILGRGRRRM